MLLGVLRRSFTRRWADWLEEPRAIRQLIPTAESGESERGLKGEKRATADTAASRGRIQWAVWLISGVRAASERTMCASILKRASDTVDSGRRSRQAGSLGMGECYALPRWASLPYVAILSALGETNRHSLTARWRDRPGADGDPRWMGVWRPSPAIAHSLNSKRYACRCFDSSCCPRGLPFPLSAGGGRSARGSWS